MSTWRPSPDEERWLEVAARLRGDLAWNLARERTGGWRSAGLFARIALFVLGLVAAALVLAVLGFNHDVMLLVAGVIAAAAAEWLKVGKRLHASGIEEGLCVGGYLLIGLWIAGKVGPGFGSPGLRHLLARRDRRRPGAAGLRLLNPLLTTCAALAFIEWLDRTRVARAIDATAGIGTTALVVRVRRLPPVALSRRISPVSSSVARPDAGLAGRGAARVRLPAGPRSSTDST